MELQRDRRKLMGGRETYLDCDDSLMGTYIMSKLKVSAYFQYMQPTALQLYLSEGIKKI